MKNNDFTDWFNEGPGFFRLDPQRSALLVVDMQYEHASPDYGLGARIKKKNPEIGEYYFNRVEKIVLPNIKKTLDFFRSKKLQVIYFTFGPEREDGSDLYPLGRMEDLKNIEAFGEKTFYPRGSFEFNILEEVEPVKGDLVINKVSSGGFATSNIDSVLRNMGMETLFFTGGATDLCVESTLRAAADRGYNCVIIEDACATWSQEAHDAAINVISRIYGISRKTVEIIREYPWECYKWKIDDTNKSIRQ